MWRWIILIAPILMAAGKVVAQTPASSTAPEVRWLPTPPEVAFRIHAESPELLVRAAEPDLRWVDSGRDPALILLWLTRGEEEIEWVVTMDRAYPVEHDGKRIWALLDEPGPDTSSEQLRSGFFALKHMREVIESPTRRRDGNQSFVEVISQRADGAAVLWVVYCSTSGLRPHQETIRSYLLFVSPDGKPHLASTNLGHVGSFPPAWDGLHRSLQFQVVWREQKAPTPFHVEVEEWNTRFPATQSDLPSYSTCRSARLEGPFPMTPQPDKQQYLAGEGTWTLRQLAETLAVYHSTGLKNRATVNALWLEALQRRNAGIDADDPVNKAQRIVVPEESATSRAINDAARVHDQAQ